MTGIATLGNKLGRSLPPLTKRSRLLEFLICGFGLRTFNMLIPIKSRRYYEAALLGELSDMDTLTTVECGGRYSLSVEPWPHGKTVAVAVSFDDLSPANEPGFTDFGGNLAGVTIRRFEKLMLRFPRLKVTHFVPACMSYDPVRGRFAVKGASVDDPRFTSWRNWLTTWASSGRVEVGLHGLHHYNYSTASPAEFEGLDYREARNLMEESIDLMLRAGFAPRGFRPPAWGLGNCACVVNVAKDLGLSYIAASGVNVGLNKSQKTVSDLVPSWYQGVLNIPQNIVLGLRPLVARRLVGAIVQRRGLISIKGHFADSYYLAASLDAWNYRWLNRFLEILDSEHDNIWFATASEIADFKLALASVQLRFRPPHVLTITNNSQLPIAGLTLKVEDKEAHVPSENGGESDILILPTLGPRETREVRLPSGDVSCPAG